MLTDPTGLCDCADGDDDDQRGLDEEGVDGWTNNVYYNGGDSNVVGANTHDSDFIGNEGRVSADDQQASLPWATGLQMAFFGIEMRVTRDHRAENVDTYNNPDARHSPGGKGDGSGSSNSGTGDFDSNGGSIYGESGFPGNASNTYAQAVPGLPLGTYDRQGHPGETVQMLADHPEVAAVGVAAMAIAVLGPVALRALATIGILNPGLVNFINQLGQGQVLPKLGLVHWLLAKPGRLLIGPGSRERGGRWRSTEAVWAASFHERRETQLQSINRARRCSKRF